MCVHRMEIWKYSYSKYIEKNGRLLQITDLGKIVTNMLSENFSEIVDLSFTADMENKLDEVEEGKEEESTENSEVGEDKEQVKEDEVV